MRVKVKDWNGNEVKNGDTIVVVRTKPLFGKFSFGFINKDGFQKIGETKEPPQHTWDVICEYKIWEDEKGILRYTIPKDDVEYIFDLSMLEWGMQLNDVICIKGKTDKEIDYYLNYFK